MLHSRDKRIAEAIKQSLSSLFQFEMKDPRLPQIVTVSHVEMTKDLKHAKVHYSQIPDDEDSLARLEELLDESAGFIRSHVAREINVKFCPTLSFHYDESAKNYQRIAEVLHDLNKPAGGKPPKGNS